MPCQIAYRDDSQQVLLFKIASCLADGSFISGVSSFNTRTGAVTLTAADVSTALGCTPLCQSDGDARYVLKSGDSMTGALSIDNGVLVANDPALELSQTWNNAAVTFTGLQSNITNTASAADSNLFNFQTDGIDRFRYAAIGQLFATRQDATNSGVTFFQRKRGNAGGATNAVAADATIGTITHSGWNGAAYVNGSRISGLANEAWTGIANGSRIDLYTTPDGSTSEQITLRLAATGQALFTDGTAALPSLTFQSDFDTGIYRIGANVLGLSTAGAERVRIDASGNVGIGVSPTNKLSVVGTAFDVVSFRNMALATGFLESDSGGVGIFNGASATGEGIYLGSSLGRVLIYVGSVEKAFFSSTSLTLSTGTALSLTSGANQRAGDATLVAGTVTVANTTVTANTRVFVTRKTSGGTIGFAVTYTVIAATSFTLTSDSALDTSTYSYLLIEVP